LPQLYRQRSNLRRQMWVSRNRLGLNVLGNGVPSAPLPTVDADLPLPLGVPFFVRRLSESLAQTEFG
jgi:hypothetical protein